MAILVYGSGGGSGNDISDTTAIQGDVLPGKYFYLADGTKVEGSMATKAAATIVPSTSDQTINANQYLLGAQTIQGSANLTAANIKSGVNIFGVTGAVQSRSVRCYWKAFPFSSYSGFSGTITVAAGFQPCLVHISAADEVYNDKSIASAIWQTVAKNGVLGSTEYDDGMIWLNNYTGQPDVDAAQLTLSWSISGTTLSLSFGRRTTTYDYNNSDYDVYIAGWFWD